ncbi:hypothetical protein BDV95DRAFT_562971 [Massariosphaeria phaeospora]|uniref:Secreted protein n=1 Tax=Massariosphaeria phaeospora TaxID=100035 RepID=A0A7C8MDP9_9PLEO|nr:hypothetical protein BDV95DRAFT_562971 [Massariosphaeria phaeospora]
MGGAWEALAIRALELLLRLNPTISCSWGVKWAEQQRSGHAWLLLAHDAFQFCSSFPQDFESVCHTCHLNPNICYAVV